MYFFITKDTRFLGFPPFSTKRSKGSQVPNCYCVFPTRTSQFNSIKINSLLLKATKLSFPQIRPNINQSIRIPPPWFKPHLGTIVTFLFPNRRTSGQSLGTFQKMIKFLSPPPKIKVSLSLLPCLPLSFTLPRLQIYIYINNRQQSNSYHFTFFPYNLPLPEEPDGSSFEPSPTHTLTVAYSDVVSHDPPPFLSDHPHLSTRATDSDRPPPYQAAANRVSLDNAQHSTQ